LQPLFKTDKVFASLVNEITNSINEQVIITNEQGIIVASTDLTRIGNYHEGAYLAMKKQQKMVMTQELTEKLQGVRKGIVLPIIIENKPLGVLGITGDPLEVEPYGQIVQRMSELFIKETIDQMTQEKMARNLELFVFDWIYENIEPYLLLERSEFFNIDVTKYNQVISLHMISTTDNLSYKEILNLKRAWDNDQDALIIRWGQGKLIIIDVGYERYVLQKKILHFLHATKKQLGDEVYVGVGQSTGYLDLLTSFEQAERACLIARKEQRIIFEEQLQFEMLQYRLDKQTKQKFIERTIATILSDKNLVATISCWLKNGMSIQKTAEELYIHKNTLYYRLQKIEEMTKMNLSNMDHLVLFYIGLRFWDEMED